MFAEVIVAFVIVAICVVIHSVGILVFGEWMLNQRFIQTQIRMTHNAFLLIIVFAVMILLHATEAGLWAVFYHLQGLFPTFETAFYFSLTSYTTIGFGDVVLPQKWRLLGAVEGISGVLLCGLSAAFVFAIVNFIFQRRIKSSTADRT
jgi:hypothetical protein